MATMNIDLGCADIACADGELTVVLRSSALIAPSAKDDIDRLRHKLTKKALTQCDDDLPFINCGPDFKLILYMKLEAVLAPAVADQLIHNLTEQIQTTKVTLTLSTDPEPTLTTGRSYGVNWDSV